MKNRVCCYTLDENYLFPTFLSARQVLRTTPNLDIIVFCIGSATEKSEAFRSAIEQSGIGFQYVDRAAIDNLPVIFARFFLHRMLDPGYGPVLYLDGDTQVLGDLSELLDVPLPPGKLLAARDPMSIATGDTVGLQKLAYLESIGIRGDLSKLYRNSGVLRFNLADWEKIAREVIRASASKDHAYRFPDQDPLNLTCGDLCLPMSYKWNFPSFFLGLGFADFIRPKVLHFMSKPRPWEGPFEPWGRPHFEVYGELVRQFPGIAPYGRRANVRKTTRYHLQQLVKGVLEKRNWTVASVRQQILASEQECFV